MFECCTWLRCRVSDWLGGSSGCAEALVSATFGGDGPGTPGVFSPLSVKRETETYSGSSHKWHPSLTKVHESGFALVCFDSSKVVAKYPRWCRGNVRDLLLKTHRDAGQSASWATGYEYSSENKGVNYDYMCQCFFHVPSTYLDHFRKKNDTQRQVTF